MKKNLKSTREACYYISESFQIPQDCIEVIYNGGSCVSIDSNNTDSGGENRFKNNLNSFRNFMDGNKNTSDVASAAEIIISIPSVVFGGQPLPYMQALNYQLACQMAKDGTENIDIDVYLKDCFLPLPNSKSRGRYVIPMAFKELLNLDFSVIEELSKQPRPEDSMVIPRRVPEAVQWFTEVYKDFETKQKTQSKFTQPHAPPGLGNTIVHQKTAEG